MPEWELVDLFAAPVAIQGMPIDSELLLRTELRRLASLEPRLVVLQSGEDLLGLALLGNYAMGYWSAGGYTLCNRLLRLQETWADEPAELADRGCQLIVGREAMWDLDEMIEIAAYFYNYRQMPAWVGACSGSPVEPGRLGKQAGSEAICVITSGESQK